VRDQLELRSIWPHIAAVELDSTPVHTAAQMNSALHVYIVEGLAQNAPFETLLSLYRRACVQTTACTSMPWRERAD